VGKIVWNGVEHDVPADGLKFTTPLGGIVIIQQDGSFIYDAPARDHSDNIPDVDSFQYRVHDANGNLSDLATAHINILDTVPEAHNDDYVLTDHNAGFRFSANVMDNDTLSADWVTHGPTGQQNIVWQVRADDGASEITVHDGQYNPGDLPTLETAMGGKVWINQDGSFSYVPPSHFSGEDSFQYQLNDGDNTPSGWATVTLHVPEPEKLITGGIGHSELSGTDGVVDVFKWSLADLGDGNASSVTNTVKGFNAGEGDKLDLRDLLQQGNDYLFDTNHLNVSVNGGSTTITVSPVSPAGTPAPTLNIVLDGVDLGYQGQDAIDHLLKNGNLVHHDG
ncbi:MAG: Ig-like domain-containing protein, partial [Betaproteobacteria bacterium]|nr:Ig-like domain-containing protein [Betaproteobacteria bacterium]